MGAPIVVIVGPTAVGKTELAVGLALRFGGEIVSADSRQVYRYMDIGTAKPTLAERRGVRHYMLDLVEPDEQYSAGRFREEGSRVLDRLGASGTPAFVVGGTGFYIRALLDGYTMAAVEPDPVLRERLRAEASAHGVSDLHRRLQAADPASAARIHHNNLPRLVRALEIVERLGGPVPSISAADEREARYIGLTMHRERLKQIADRRVLVQVDEGLVEETRLLLAMGYDPQSAALSGFGYRQMVEYLRGDETLAEAIHSYQVDTHQYIRRQMTWFRSDRRIQWLDAESEPESAAADLVGGWLGAEEGGG